MSNVCIAAQKVGLVRFHSHSEMSKSEPGREIQRMRRVASFFDELTAELRVLSPSPTSFCLTFTMQTSKQIRYRVSLCESGTASLAESFASYNHFAVF